MAENLRYNSANSKCYFETRSEDSTYCLEHGRLYKWNDAKKVCPEGWRLPDSTYWWILRKAVS